MDSATARCSKRNDAETHSLHQDAHDDLASSPCLTKEDALAFCRHTGINRPPPSHAGHRCWRRASDCCRGCVPAACSRGPDCEVASSSRSALASWVACQQASQLPTSHPSEATRAAFVIGPRLVLSMAPVLGPESSGPRAGPAAASSRQPPRGLARQADTAPRAPLGRAGAPPWPH